MSLLVPIIIIFLILASIFLVTGFFIWRNILRFAKSIERGIKMVPLLIDLPPPSEDTEVGTRDVRDVVQEKISQAEVLYNLIAGTFKKGFKSRFYGQRHVGFELVAINGVINFYAAVPVVLVSVIKQAILTAYPGAQIDEVEDHNIFSPTGKIDGTKGGEIVLKQSYSYPIATFTQAKRDAMQAMIGAMSSLEAGDGAALQLLLRPADTNWTKTSESLVAKKSKKTTSKNRLGISVGDLIAAPLKVPEAKEDKPTSEKQLTSLEQSVLDSIEEKTKHPGYEVMIRIVASSTLGSRAQGILNNLIASFSMFDSPGLNGFKFNPAKDMEKFVTSFIFRFFPPVSNKNILNSIELATLFHLPDSQFTPTSQVQRQYSKQVEGPSKLPKSGLLLGYNAYRSVKKEIRLSHEDRRRHTYLVGQTGTGKSTMLENLAVQDMINGNGFAFIDPHGDAAEFLMSVVPKERTEDVIYFNPGDLSYPLGLNMYEFDTPDQKDFLIQEAINMLYRLYDPQHQGIIGPRYEHWFRNASLTLMSDPQGATFIEIPKVFTDKQYQREKLKHVTDPTVLDFWNKEMAQTSDYHKSEILGWFVSKFGAFVSNEMMRNIIGQTKGALNLRQIMDEGKILIVNLSKGRVGELNSMLLGMIFVMKFQAAAMSRASIPQDERRDFSLFVDEFQNFSTDSFASILSEARKYRLNLIVANQFISQLSEEIRDAVFGNVGTIISYRTGPNDADFLVKQFAPIFDTRDLVNLPNFNSVVRLMVDGVPSQPFSMSAFDKIGKPNPQLAVALRQLSAAKYGRPRATVEKEIFKRLESKPALPSPAPYQTSPFAGATNPNRLGSQTTNMGSGGSSFLDDWLAKRRQTSQNNLLASSQQSPRPQTTPNNVQPETSSANDLQPQTHKFLSRNQPTTQALANKAVEDTSEHRQTLSHQHQHVEPIPAGTRVPSPSLPEAQVDTRDDTSQFNAINTPIQIPQPTFTNETKVFEVSSEPETVLDTSQFTQANEAVKQKNKQLADESQKQESAHKAKSQARTFKPGESIMPSSKSTTRHLNKNVIDPSIVQELLSNVPAMFSLNEAKLKEATKVDSSKKEDIEAIKKSETPTKTKEDHPSGSRRKKNKQQKTDNSLPAKTSTKHV
jgi:hypothetical protein